jgi:hypothetical protein
MYHFYTSPLSLHNIISVKEDTSAYPSYLAASATFLQVRDVRCHPNSMNLVLRMCHMHTLTHDRHVAHLVPSAPVHCLAQSSQSHRALQRQNSTFLVPTAFRRSCAYVRGGGGESQREMGGVGVGMPHQDHLLRFATSGAEVPSFPGSQIRYLLPTTPHAFGVSSRLVSRTQRTRSSCPGVTHGGRQG